jgi:EF-P beta-lysylation protein EpmB
MWKKILRQNFTDWKKLADFLHLDDDQRKMIIEKPNFPLNLPLRLAEKIRKSTLDDPILKQFLPTIDELKVSEGFVQDPVADQSFRREERLLHKYEGRVLLICTSACAMHCRFCFRQNFDYPMGPKLFEKELELIADDASIQEVILSGGDPLSLDNSILEQLFASFSAIPHLKRLRIHTRFPVGIPERIDEGFLALIEKLSLQTYFVLHLNHPLELDDQIISHLKALKKTGAVLLNHSVLLQGVNDDEATLAALSEKLVNNGILPYYIHQLDKVAGASHFETTQEKGIALMQQLSKRLSGYAVPKYVREIPGQPSKTLIF